MKRPARAAPANSLGRWAVAGALGGALVALVAYAPARWLASAVTVASKEHVLLQEPRGTLWAGSARLSFTGGEGSQDRTTFPGRLQWTLAPDWRGLRTTLHLACCTPQPLNVHLAPQWGGARVALADSQSQWPAHLLSGLGTPWNTLQPQGQLHLQSQALAAQWSEGRLQVEGSAELQAKAMGSRLSTLQPMGSYRVRIQGGATPALQLDTLEGALQLTGSGQWVGSRLRFNGEASATPEREGALANLLNIIGRRSGSRSLISTG